VGGAGGGGGGGGGRGGGGGVGHRQGNLQDSCSGLSNGTDDEEPDRCWSSGQSEQYVYVANTLPKT
jgi:hypothetical protein